MAVVRMGREAERLWVLDRSFYDLRQTSWSDRAHPLDLIQLSDQVLEILMGACAPECILHSEAAHIHEKYGKDELSLRLLSCDQQVTDPLVPELGPHKRLDDRPFLGSLKSYGWVLRAASKQDGTLRQAFGLLLRHPFLL